MEDFWIGVGVVILIGYFLLRYLDGDLTIASEEIIKKGSIVTSSGSCTGTYFIIKRVYKSGRIKLINKDVK